MTSTSNSTSDPAKRTFHSPAVDIAATRNIIPDQRNLYNRAGCLSFLFATILAGLAGVWLTTGPQWMTGLPVILLGIFVWKRRPILGTFILFIGLAFAVHGGIEFLFGDGFLGTMAFIVAMLVLGVLWYMSVGGPTRVYANLSKAADQRCTIAFFRPFTEEHAKDARNLVVPLLDGYGKVIHVHDLSFDSAEHDWIHGQEYSDSLGRFRLRGQMHQFDDDTWRAGVQEILTYVDIAVVDISNLSPNVLWELANCYKHLPANRVIGIARSEDPTTDVERFADLSLKLAPYGIDKNISPFCLCYADAVEGRVWFRSALHQVMVKIAAETTQAEALDPNTPAGA